MWGQQVNRDVLTDYYKQVVNTLADDSMQGRPCCSVYEQKSAAFIATQLKSITGKKAKYQFFNLQAKDSLQPCKSTNVYYYKNNHADSTVIIGAHYDHLGYGGSLSKSLNKRGVHHGADDNASGIALMLGLLKTYQQWGSKNYNYLFVAYSAHEVGLYGSSEFAAMALTKYKPIAVTFNFDMVGRMDTTDKWIKIFTNAFTTEILQAAMLNNCKLRMGETATLLQLDTKAFMENKINCISFTTGLHDDYHKISDTAQKINYTGIYYVQQAVEYILKNINP